MPVEIERYSDVIVARLEDELVEDNIGRLKVAMVATPPSPP